MKNKLITYYLSSIIMLTSMGIIVSYKEYSEMNDNIQYIDFSEKPLHIKGKCLDKKN